MKLFFTTDSEQARDTTKITTHPDKQTSWQEMERALSQRKQLTVINAKNDRHVKLELQQVVAIETEGSMCNVQTLDGAMFLLNQRLKSVNEALANTRVMQINNQVMVNLDHVTQFVSASNARIELHLPNQLKYYVSRHYLKQFRRNFL
ncbi:LytTR family transcriptional regulator [Vagococcus sp. BWB3-3]|uniref:LytTR family transcriptional regulator n=1 Tax=Vagococcus allomyrinae TaxID=2794353 RepID=A0A940PBZ1_9ENTE|nr:LytTR family transcriptional regulator [Vagococcus allomyrinae]